MNFDFSKAEALYIYGKFRQELVELEKLNGSVNASGDIKLIKSILGKMEAAFPGLSKLPLQGTRDVL